MEYSDLAVKIEQLNILLKMVFERAAELTTAEIEAALGLACDLVSPIANGISQLEGQKIAE
jgi:hypothetical protein